MFLVRAGACLAAALILAPAAQAWDGRAPQQPPASTVKPPQEQTPPKTERQGRKKRTPRTSRRQPSSQARGSFDEQRASRVAGPMRQELTFTANGTGGYDDNLTAGLGTGAGAARTAMASGTTANLDATLGYFKGNTLRSIHFDTTGTLTAYPGYVDRPAAGGIANVGARTNVGRDTTLSVGERAGYEPFFNAFSQGAGGAPLPAGDNSGGASPAASLFERRSWNSNTSVSLDRRLGRGAGTSIGYAYRRQDFTTDDRGDSASHSVTAGYRQRVSSGVRARADYRYQTLDYTDAGIANRATRNHRIVGGPEMETQLSRRRSLSLTLAAGAGYIETTASATRPGYDAWVPVGNARLRLTLSPTTYVEGDYRRDFSLFQGVTDEVYTTDAASLMTGGMLTRRLRLTLGGTFSNWKTPVASGIADKLNIYGATTQVGVLVTENVIATVGYYYYHHRYSDPGALPEGFPAQYGRNAVRVGFTVWVPLLGAPTTSPTNTQR